MYIHNSTLKVKKSNRRVDFSETTTRTIFVRFEGCFFASLFLDSKVAFASLLLDSKKVAFASLFLDSRVAFASFLLDSKVAFASLF